MENSNNNDCGLNGSSNKSSVIIVKGDKEFENFVKEGVDFDFVVFLYSDNKKIQFVYDLKNIFNAKNSNKEQKWKIVETIERMPGRIVIIGGKPNNWDNQQKNNTSFKKWIMRRICWVDNNTLTDSISLKLKINNSKIDNDLLSEEEKLILKIYELWVMHILKLKGIKKITLNLSLDGSSSQTGYSGLLPYKEAILGYLISENLSFNNIDELKNLLSFILKGNLLIENAYKEEFWKYWVINEGWKSRNNRDINNFLAQLEYFFKNCCKSNNTSAVNFNKTNLENFLKKIKDISNNIKSPFTILNNDERNNDFKCELEANGTEEVKVDYPYHGSSSEKAYYFESLSGASISFPIIVGQVKNDKIFKKYKMFYSLIENALIKVLVVDERIAKIVSSDSFLKESLEWAGIDVRNDLIEKDDNDQKGTSGSEYDFLIIHQGILDKDNKKIDWQEIQNWKENHYNYVIITSGRGIPANLPRYIKFLPFSSLEQTISSKPHDKLILTKILFKLFPN